MRNLRVSNRPAVCCSRATEMEHSHCARERDRGNLGWLSQSNRILTLIIILLLLFCALSVSPSCPLCSHLSLCVFHPFSRQSDRVCPTGQPFSTHHAHHFLSSFPPVCFFHLFWPVHSPSTTPRKPFYLFVCVCVCASVCGP